ncbi:MAG: glycoside hydrolase family 76 protein [Candidatus Pacebacteria bacterium]|nr:glycoside hydrolase family 76 protein [Candidatus Paceibacterota bacterium]MDD5445677.1 glycoside hydrolase family 76 protein [Candidatus Paceibacterota bacterium]
MPNFSKNKIIISVFIVVFFTLFFWIYFNNFKVNFESPAVGEYEITKSFIEEKIKQGKEFLLQIENEEENGFYKYYLPFEEEKTEDRLHTTYSASIVYSFLFIHEFDKDKKTLEKLSSWGDFLLRMQNLDKEDKRYGSFVYSYFFDEKNLDFGSKIKKKTINSKGEKFTDYFYVDNQGRELRYVVGTNSKTIFTLLRLYEYTKEEKYLNSAVLSGNWLLTMQNENGTVRPYVRYENGKWLFGSKESFLYQGQVLSAFSRLYKITKDERYYEGAKKIADRFADKIEKANGEFIVDDYRTVNSISNSWVVMSLMDFYNISFDNYYKEIIFRHSGKILEDQIKSEKNPSDFGRYKTAYSSSGNGWIAEVLTEVYRFCLKEKGDSCSIYKDSVTDVIDWIIGHTYSKENTQIKDIIGSVYWSKEYRHVRSDSVAHSLNAYARIIEFLPD